MQISENAIYDFNRKKWIEIKEDIVVDNKIVLNREYMQIKSIVE